MKREKKKRKTKCAIHHFSRPFGGLAAVPFCVVGASFLHVVIRLLFLRQLVAANHRLDQKLDGYAVDVVHVVCVAVAQGQADGLEERLLDLPEILLLEPWDLAVRGPDLVQEVEEEVDVVHGLDPFVDRVHDDGGVFSQLQGLGLFIARPQLVELGEQTDEFTVALEQL